MAEYIDRDALNKRLSALSKRMGSNFNTFTVLSEINKFPAASVRENVKAQWIEDRTEIVCSKCNTRFSDEIVFMNRNMEDEPLKYCPNCGADMRGTEDG